MATIKDIHIGKLILRQMKIQRMSYAELGKELHLDRSTVYWMTRQKSVDSERLYHLSHILQFDFYRNVYQPLLYESTRLRSGQDNPEATVTCVSAAQLAEILSGIPPSSHITIRMQISSFEP